MKERSAYWDNFRAILIFLVVLGHILIPVGDKGRSLNAVYYWIYLFHMPAFVFASGFFSKSYVRKDKKNSQLIGFIILYLGFVFADWIIYCLFKGIKGISLFSTQSAPWYLLGLLFWYIVIPYFATAKNKIPAVLIMVLLGLLIGMDPRCGAFLSLSRVIVFFPFFLAGFYTEKVFPIRKRRIWIKCLAALLLVCILAVLFRWSGDLKQYLDFIYADKSYETLGYGENFPGGMLIRLIMYVIASVMLICVLLLTPEKRLFFTYLGERTLSIYIFHRLIKNVLEYLGLYKYIGNNFVTLLICIAAAALLTWLTSAKPLNSFLRKAFMISK